jgi:outer membrane murein-binding lipoprotein Lpp
MKKIIIPMAALMPGFTYMAIIPVLTGAIQELNARVEELERQLKAK